MREDLKIGEAYDGFLFLAQSALKPPILASHCHDELELNLVTKGFVTYLIDGKRYTFSQGTMLWIFPSQEHQLVDRSREACYYVAVFKPGLIDRACRAPAYVALRGDRPTGGTEVLSTLLHPETYDYLTRTMDGLMEDSLDDALLNREAGFGFNSSFRFQHGDPDALNAGLHYLLIHCWKTFQKGRSGVHPVKLHPSVHKALKWLNGEGLEWALPELAKACSISETYLSRLFKQQVGMPLNAYRNAIKLRLFMQHFHQPEQRTILESVYAAGFGSYAQFYKVFHRHYGCGPREYLQVPAEVD
jgi:AraC-like DNA-binding protein